MVLRGDVCARRLIETNAHADRDNSASCSTIEAMGSALIKVLA